LTDTTAAIPTKPISGLMSASLGKQDGTLYCRTPACLGQLRQAEGQKAYQLGGEDKDRPVVERIS
jgi:hypothetical protein